ncbi:hypothetical protein DV738_g895, partial [Chaetothyriales sp. CBS 135597]
MSSKFTEILDSHYQSSSPESDARLEDLIAASIRVGRARTASETSSHSERSNSSNQWNGEQPGEKTRSKQIRSGVRRERPLRERVVTHSLTDRQTTSLLNLFEARRSELLVAISASLETVLQQVNQLNRTLEGIIEIGSEFGSVEALWSQFEMMDPKAAASRRTQNAEIADEDDRTVRLSKAKQR